MKWDAAGTCVHSLLKCGECRHKEKELNANGLAAVDAEVDAFRKKALDEYWAKQGAAAPVPLPPFGVLVQPQPIAPVALFKLDLGCGTVKKAGFIGVDSKQFPGVDVVCDLSKDKWPWPDNSVEEVSCQQMLEHIPGKEVDWELEAVTLCGSNTLPYRLVRKIRYPRAHFFNELWRVLKPGGQAAFGTPHWCSPRAYGDPTHEWPPVCEWTWCYLDKQWRATQAPADDMFTCDFTAGYGYAIAPWLQGRNDEYVREAVTKWKEAATDMLATLTARK